MSQNSYRLNSYIARALGISRRKADLIVQSGEVAVDGELTTRPDIRISEEHSVHYQGKPLQILDKTVWILLNKPMGYITTKNDPSGRPIVMDLLPEEYRNLFPVGRLDSSTTGVMLFTNDGQLAQKLLHPKYCVPREYNVEIEGVLGEEGLEIAKRGVIIDGRRAVPSEIDLVRRTPNGEFWRIQFREGRYHEVKRFFAALGHEVKSLKRLSFAGIETGDMVNGSWRFLSEFEISLLINRLEEYVED